MEYLLPASAHDLGSRWFAIPFSCGSCIRYPLPALTGVFKVLPDFSSQANTSLLSYSTVFAGFSEER